MNQLTRWAELFEKELHEHGRDAFVRSVIRATDSPFTDPRRVAVAARVLHRHSTGIFGFDRLMAVIDRYLRDNEKEIARRQDQDTILEAISWGYEARGEGDRFVVVKNPKATPEGDAMRGEDPFLVLDLSSENEEVSNDPPHPWDDTPIPDVL